jgi:chromate transporter
VALGALFLRLGLTAFGGPAGHIAVMRDEFVRRRGWMDDPTFVDLIGVANLIPGPTSTELAMHIGYRRRGGAGLVVAGLGFLLPAVLIVGVLAWVYVAYGQRPEIEALLTGIAPVVVAIVAHAGWSIALTAMRGAVAWAVFAAAMVAIVGGLPEILVLLGAGVAGLVIRTGTSAAQVAVALAGPPWWRTAATVAVVSAATPLSVLGVFLKIGTVLFGSGYVLVALLRSELVDGLGWITEAQLVDAVAVGQATPGPLFSTATFIGYVVGGPIGAVAATIGIFLPAFVAVALSVRVLDRLRQSLRARAFLDGVNAAAVALLAVVAVQLALGGVRDLLGVTVMLAAFALLVRGIGTGWLIAAGGGVALIRLVLAPS